MSHFRIESALQKPRGTLARAFTPYQVGDYHTLGMPQSGSPEMDGIQQKQRLALLGEQLSGPLEPLGAPQSGLLILLLKQASGQEKTHGAPQNGRLQQGFQLQSMFLLTFLQQSNGLHSLRGALLNGL